jgi:hypothetical protein
MRPDGKRKKLRSPKKIILCEQTAARRRPDSKRRFAAQRPKKLRKRKFLRALHLSVAVAKKKILHGALTHLLGCDRINKILARGLTKLCRSGWLKKIAA